MYFDTLETCAAWIDDTSMLGIEGCEKASAEHNAGDRLLFMMMNVRLV